MPYKKPLRYAGGGLAPDLYGTIGSVGSGIIDAATAGKPSMGGAVASNTLKYAGTGAGIGTAIMPGLGTAIGAGVGALGGAIVGVVQGNRQRKEAAAAAKQAAEQKALRDQMTRQQTDMYSRQVLQNFPVQGNAYTPFMLALGGNTPGLYKAEGGEVVEHAPGDLPQTDIQSSLTRLSATTARINGDSHEARSGGVAMQQTSPARILSDRLPVSPTLLKKLKSL